MIYFDNAATTKPHKEAIGVLNAVLRDNYANPSSLHKGGIEAEKIISAAKKTILSKLPGGGRLIFTSGGTESNNLALFGLREPKGEKQRKIITTTIEHPSVAEPLDEIEKHGFSGGSSTSILRLSPVKGENFEDRIISAVDQDVMLVSVMAVNNETGFVIDTPKIYSAVKSRFPNCTVHTDAAQGFMKIPADGDLISLSAHKVHGVKGVGALFIKDGVALKPRIRGGGQQDGLRSGTEPTELIAAFEAAVQNFKYEHKHFTELSEYLSKLLEDFNGVNYRLNSRGNLPGIVNFTVNGVKSEILLHYFAENDIYVSSGSACAKNSKSKALLAFGVSERDADSALRLSFSEENTTAEIDRFAEVLKAGIQRFKR
ncbi:MAG: cysteine desulfurase [Oscillospiraceae bacterium]|jgi:cysteine desulfurase|nr:cysteine desulfurase [Oscillospiraceae bacterium]